MADIQTGRVLHRTMTGTRIASSTGLMTPGHTCCGMTMIVATSMDSYASK